jgi:alkylated DNA repair protein alkB homolog 1
MTVILGVPRVFDNTLPPHFFAAHDEEEPIPEWLIYEEYLQTTRININVRQVFPKGFDPQLS